MIIRFIKRTMICLISVISTGCNAPQPQWQEEISESTEFISIDPDKAISDMLFSDIFSRIDYVRIPTDSVFLIGEIDKLMVSGDYLFIMDNRITNSVFCFDKNGNKVFQIDKRGAGPGEYIDMRDICYNPEKKEIGILCYVRHKILHYSMQGKFLREEPLLVFTCQAQPTSTGAYAFYCNYTQNERLKRRGLYANLFTGTPGKMQIKSVGQYFPGRLNPSLVWHSKSWFSRYGDTLSIKPDHADIVYHTDGGNIYPAYKLDFGSHNAGERYWKKVMERGITFKELNSYCERVKLCESHSFMESDNYMSFVYKIGHSAVKVLYSKNTKCVVQTQIFRNDMDSVAQFHPLAMEGNKLYCIVEAEDIVEKKNASLLGRSFPKSLSDSIDEFDNPIVAIFTLKEF